MKVFKEFDIQSMGNHPGLIGTIVDPKDKNRTYYLLIENEYAILGSVKLHTFPKTGQSKWITHQIELPKNGIPWIVKTLENKFFKLSGEGGLPAEVRHYEEVVDGEELGILRVMSLGENEDREAGYAIKTFSRESEWGSPRSMSFKDSLWFEHGFFDLLKSAAEKINSGLWEIEP